MAIHSLERKIPEASHLPEEERRKGKALCDQFQLLRQGILGLGA